MTPEERRAFIASHTTLQPVPFVPEIRLYTGGLAMPLWEAAFFADERLPVPPPMWAWAWAGGVALARHILDTPSLVRERRVADIGTGGGIVAIAAAMGGAARVDAIDVEPYAIAACRLNAAANGVESVVRPEEGDPIGSDDGWDVVLAGDVWYEDALAAVMEPWLRGLAGRGALVLTGDVGRTDVPSGGVVERARFVVPTLVDLEDVAEKSARVLEITPARAPRAPRPGRP